jgi:GNAT superfamily N-acetyltransferase
MAAWIVKMFKSMLLKNAAETLGIHTKVGKALGFTIDNYGEEEGQMVPELQGKTVAVLALVTVLSTERRKGVGSELVRLFLKKAKEKGCSGCVLDAVSLTGKMTADELVSFYQKQGFRSLPHSRIAMWRPI